MVDKIANILDDHAVLVAEQLPSIWHHGRDIIPKMRDMGNTNWRQSLWFAFYVEDVLLGILPNVPTEEEHLLGSGRTRIDWRCEGINIDIKTHSVTKGPTIILNDKEAMDVCLDRDGAFGFLVLSVEIDQEPDAEFKAWHTKIKGGLSKYAEKNRRAGVASRAIWRAAKPICLSYYHLEYFDTLGINRQGKNSNGKPRNVKYQCNLKKHDPTWRLDI